MLLRGNCGTDPTHLFPAVFGTEHISSETAIPKSNGITSSDFPLQSQLQSSIAAVLLEIIGHHRHSFFPTNNNQQFSGPGNGSIENAAAKQIWRTIPSRQNDCPVL